MNLIPRRESDLERTVLGPLRRTSMQFYFLLGGLGLVFALAFLTFAIRYHREGRRRKRVVRKMGITAIRDVFQAVRQKFQLVDQMRQHGLVDLCELRLEHGEFVQQALNHVWRDARGAILHELCDLR